MSTTSNIFYHPAARQGLALIRASVVLVLQLETLTPLKVTIMYGLTSNLACSPTLPHLGLIRSAVATPGA